MRSVAHANDSDLRAPMALLSALIISAAGVFGADRLPAPFGLIIGGLICALATLLFYYADHRRFVRDPAGKLVADRWQIVLTFAGFRWTRDKAICAGRWRPDRHYAPEVPARLQWAGQGCHM